MKTVMMLSFIMALSGCTLNSDCAYQADKSYWTGREDGRQRLLNELKEEQNTKIVYSAKVKIVGGFYKGQVGIVNGEQNDDWVYVVFIHNGISRQELVTKLNLKVIK